jgi:hypothetical protein
MHYIPKVNDYVRWENSLGNVIEGWVYFYCSDYITIEIRVKEKPDNLVPQHKKVHVLVVCYNQFWNELEYVKSRECIK